MIIEKGAPWAGTETSLQQLVEVDAKFADRLPELLAGKDVSEEPYKPYQVTENGTAIILVKGPMVNIDLPPKIAAWFGITSYPALQTQFAQAQVDADVKRILLDVNSGGGSVSGLSDTVATLRGVA